MSDYFDSFDNDIKESKGYCDSCRKRFYSDNEIFIVILDPPKKGIDVILTKNPKVRLCENDFLRVKEFIKKEIIK